MAIPSQRVSHVFTDLPRKIPAAQPRCLANGGRLVCLDEFHTLLSHLPSAWILLDPTVRAWP